MTEQGKLAIKPGLRVLVTAGAAGIGRAIADTLADNGARIHVCDIAEGVLEGCRAERPAYGTSLCDVAEEAQVDRLFEDVLSTLGGLDVLVNNAGIAGPTASVDEIDPAEWRRTIDVNLNGQFYCARRAVPLLKATGEGAIINISSVAGRLGYAFRTPYAATKWAIVGLTQSLAMELGPDGLRVNAILPGIVEGPRIERVIAARAEAVGVDYAEMEQEYLNKVSLRRMVTAQDVANMALYLCSPLGRNVSGQALSVCGNVETL
jgi:NAD(P)-dependent dehydrogenase (short-subunit alcohol dehydrogenase family)